MYYFESDPLQIVHADLRKNKTPSHFDDVLERKGELCDAYRIAHTRLYPGDQDSNPKTRQDHFHKGSKEFIRENMSAFVKWLDMKL